MQPQQPLRDGLQQRVADGMTESVVDLLEAVEIEHQDRQAAPALTHGRQRLLEPLTQERPVGQVGQNVVMRQVRDPRLGPPALGDVLVRADQAPVGHRLAQHGDEAPVGEMEDFTDLAVKARDAGFNEFLRLDVAVYAARNAGLEYLSEGCAGLQLLRIEAIHFRVAVVGHDDALVAIEHAQSLGHVRERGLEALPPARQFRPPSFSSSCWRELPATAATRLMPSTATAALAMVTESAWGDSDNAVMATVGSGTYLCGSHRGEVMGRQWQGSERIAASRVGCSSARPRRHMERRNAERGPEDDRG